MDQYLGQRLLRKVLIMLSLAVDDPDKWQKMG